MKLRVMSHGGLELYLQSSSPLLTARNLQVWPREAYSILALRLGVGKRGRSRDYLRGTMGSDAQFAIRNSDNIGRLTKGKLLICFGGNVGIPCKRSKSAGATRQDLVGVLPYVLFPPIFDQFFVCPTSLSAEGLKDSRLSVADFRICPCLHRWSLAARRH